MKDLLYSRPWEDEGLSVAAMAFDQNFLSVQSMPNEEAQRDQVSAQTCTT